jgi:NADPH:quinone reductase-like Zn-dependent oxidoreductase
MTFEAAAGIPTGGLEALHFIRLAQLKKGDQLLINGAGGSIGTIAIQLGKYYGAKVTAVDSTDKLETLKLAGADFSIDYMKEDYTKNGKRYDAIFDVIGKSNYEGSINSLNDNGSYFFADWKQSHKWNHRFRLNKRNIKVLFGGTKQIPENLNFLKELIEKDMLFTVIDKIMPLEKIAEAHRYVEEGHKKGNLIITIQ